MIKPSIILNRLLIYKNYKIFLLIFYSILGLLVYFNWDYLSELWMDNLMNINREFEELKSIMIIMYYCFLSFYAIIFLFYPILIFDKRYENDYKVKINLPKLNKENSFKAIKDILLFVAFPVISVLGILLWILLDIAFTSIGYVLSILTLIFVAIMIIYLIVFNLYKIVKKLF